MPNTIQIKTASPSVAIVALVGEHDLGEYEPLKVAFARAAIRARNVVVDLSQCEFIDSTVIAVLLHAHSVVVGDNGRFALALPAEPNTVTRVAELAHLAEMIPTYTSIEAAIAGFPRLAAARLA